MVEKTQVLPPILPLISVSPQSPNAGLLDLATQKSKDLALLSSHKHLSGAIQIHLSSSKQPVNHIIAYLKNEMNFIQNFSGTVLDTYI